MYYRRRDIIEAVLIFDADNTLWDTDSVFRSAQLALLEILAKYGLLTDPESQLETLRMLDRELFSKMGRFEYDFKVLSAALAYYYYKQLPLKDAVHKAISDSKEGYCYQLAVVIDDACHAFKQGLSGIPNLYSDTEAMLSSICALRASKNPVATVLLSEGEPGRLKLILEAHKIVRRGFFDDIIIERTKSKEIFERAKQSGLKHLHKRGDSAQTLFFLIGDSLKRDIKFGNQLGFVTVYKPSPFMGREEPRELDERPCYTIQKLAELPSLLNSLGFPAGT